MGVLVQEPVLTLSLPLLLLLQAVLESIATARVAKVGCLYDGQVLGAREARIRKLEGEMVYARRLPRRALGDVVELVEEGMARRAKEEGRAMAAQRDEEDIDAHF